MERKYTPGPWEAVKVNWDHMYIRRALRGDAHVPGYIADVYNIGKSKSYEANARLIAAAPDLVEALAAVRRYLAQCPPHAGDTTGTEHGRMMDAAGAALLKAGHDL